MMDFEEWLLKKQKMNLNWFLTMIPDKKAYCDKYDEYRCRSARMHAEMQLRDIKETTKELASLA